MLKLQRPSNTNTPSKQRDTLHFKFSSFQALQIPKGWDRLFVCVIHVETGKTVAKLGKALVKNGSCQWTETLSESFNIARDDSSKGYEECLVKLLVSTGSTRSNILGEAIINVANYTGSRASSAVSLPLKKCSYGTTLQVKIQRLTPRSKTSVEESKKSSSQEKDQNVDRLDIDSNSYRSDYSSDSTGIPLKEDKATTSHPSRLDSKVASESPFGTSIVTVKSAVKSEEYDFPEREVGGGINGGLVPDHYPANQPSGLYKRDDFRSETAMRRSSMMSVDSSRNLLEAAEDTIEELRAEAKMWERNARKLMTDLDISRNEYANLSKKHAGLGMELSTAYAENDGLKSEVEKLKSMVNQNIREDPIIRSENLGQIRKELENEIRYQQDLNDELGQQLKQSQESNIELVSVLQEMEETIEQQRIEMENSVARTSEENRSLLGQLKQLEESEKKLKGDIELLQEALRDKSDELENERRSNGEILARVERDYKHKISIKEEEIACLEATLSGCLEDEHFEGLDGNNESNEDLMRELESLREKVVDLEKDCTELTDENLELLFKLKNSDVKDIRKCSSFDSSPSDESEVSDPKFQMSHLGLESSEHFAEILKQMDIALNLLMKPWYGKSGLMVANKTETTATKMTSESVLDFLQEINKLLETRITESDELLRNHETEFKERDDVIADAKMKMKDGGVLEVQVLEESRAKSEENYADLMKEFDEKRSEFSLVEADMVLKEQEMKFLLENQGDLEAEVYDLQQKTGRLEQDLELALRENKISSEFVEKLQNELERNLELLERKSSEMENSLSAFQEENMQLHEYVSELEAQIQKLEDEKETYLKETDNHKSISMSLEDENQKSKAEMEIQISDLKRMSEDMRKQLLGAQEECEHLYKEENASLVRESIQIKTLNTELVDQLSESKRRLCDFTKQVESLEDHLTSMLHDFVERENSLRSDIDALVREMERVSFEASNEVSGLLADKAELQVLLQEVKSESELKVQDLTNQVAGFKQSHERLVVEHERILKTLGNYKRSEEKLKTNLNDLELKHTISEYERGQLTKEMGILKVQLKNMSSLEDQILKLKSELEESRLDKGELEMALHNVSGDYEELKVEKVLLSEKISIFEGAMSELEECKRTKLCLEEKILEIEKELRAKEILCIENGDLKIQLSETKKANMEFQKKMYRLEEEKDEWLKKAEALEENLKLMMEEMNNIHNQGVYNHSFHDQDRVSVNVDNKNKSLHDSSTTSRETKSSLEIELRDLRERYLEMSLKYAEVESQREDLVMKLRASRGGRRWFV